MSPGKSDVLRSRLTAAGLSAEACTKYVNTLKAFLNAKLTKSKYEDEMSRVLPKDKIHVHNAIIHEILFRAQLKQEGVRDLPILVPIKEKRPAQPRPTKPQSSKSPLVKIENVRPSKTGTKRPHEETEFDHKLVPSNSLPSSGAIVNNTTVGSSNVVTNDNVPVSPATAAAKQPPTKKHKPGRRLPETDKTRPSKPKVEKASPKIGEKRKVLERPILAGSLPSPLSTSNSGSNSMLKTASGNGVGAPAVSSLTEIPTYDMLRFHSLPTGHDVDSDMYWRLKQVVKRIAMEQCGMNNVKDEAVMAMAEGIEIHLRTLIAAGAKQRAIRDDTIPKKHIVCGPIDARDIREVSRWNTGLLGEDPGLELERLLMLL